MQLTRYYPLSLLFIVFICGAISSGIVAAEKPEADTETSALETEQSGPAPVTTNRESEISQQLEAVLMTGEALWLGEAEQRFLALFEESTEDNIYGAVILLHDLGGNADLPQLISAMRKTLPKKGWHTLSLQLPIVNADEEKNVYLERLEVIQQRITAGITVLQQKNITEIAIIGHGLGAAAGLLYVSNNQQSPIKSIVGISIPGANSLLRTDNPRPGSVTLPVAEPQADLEPAEADKQDVTENSDPAITNNSEDPQNGQPLDLYLTMQAITLPLLDIYGALDHQDVIREAGKRAAVMHKAKKSDYLQQRIQGADHAFHGLEEQLIRRIRGWLNKISSVKSG